MVRYVQNHWVAPLDGATHMPGGGHQAFDGHAEHWFETRESYEAAMASEQWRRTVADGPTGFDAGTLVGGVIEERVISWDETLDGRVYPEGVSGPAT
jgi:hypothetical protein